VKRLAASIPLTIPNGVCFSTVNEDGTAGETEVFAEG